MSTSKSAIRKELTLGDIEKIFNVNIPHYYREPILPLKSQINALTKDDETPLGTLVQCFTELPIEGMEDLFWALMKTHSFNKVNKSQNINAEEIVPCDVNLANKEGVTPIMHFALACSGYNGFASGNAVLRLTDYRKMVSALIENGADLTLKAKRFELQSAYNSQVLTNATPLDILLNDRSDTNKNLVEALNSESKITKIPNNLYQFAGKVKQDVDGNPEPFFIAIYLQSSGPNKKHPIEHFSGNKKSPQFWENVRTLGKLFHERNMAEKHNFDEKNMAEEHKIEFAKPMESTTAKEKSNSVSKNKSNKLRYGLIAGAALTFGFGLYKVFSSKNSTSSFNPLKIKR